MQLKSIAALGFAAAVMAFAPAPASASVNATSDAVAATEDLGARLTEGWTSARCRCARTYVRYYRVRYVRYYYYY
jgi:hypothetical protein